MTVRNALGDMAVVFLSTQTLIWFVWHAEQGENRFFRVKNQYLARHLLTLSIGKQSCADSAANLWIVTDPQGREICNPARYVYLDCVWGDENKYNTKVKNGQEVKSLLSQSSILATPGRCCSS